jgi:hypothetical protein
MRRGTGHSSGGRQGSALSGSSRGGEQVLDAPLHLQGHSHGKGLLKRWYGKSTALSQGGTGPRPLRTVQARCKRIDFPGAGVGTSRSRA